MTFDDKNKLRYLQKSPNSSDVWLGDLYKHVKTEAATRGVLNKMVLKKDVTKLTEKHLCQRLIFNKVAGLRPLLKRPTLLKKKTLTQLFSCEFCEIFKNTYCTEHLWTSASVKKFLTQWPDIHAIDTDHFSL